MKLNSKSIGLFGTCGNSKWRDEFIRMYEKLGVPYFNPQVADWKPELAQIEAWHLVNDNVILFPITDETYAVGSMAEVGFSVLSSLRWNTNRFVILFIAPAVDAAKIENPDPASIKNSNTARALLKAHLQQNATANVYVVDNLEDMLRLSVLLHGASNMLQHAKTDTWKQRMDPNFWNSVIATTGAGFEPGEVKDLAEIMNSAFTRLERTSAAELELA